MERVYVPRMYGQARQLPVFFFTAGLPLLSTVPSWVYMPAAATSPMAGYLQVPFAASSTQGTGATVSVL
jgi:hypothetical protein